MKRPPIYVAAAAFATAVVLAFAAQGGSWDDLPCGPTEDTAHVCAPGEVARDGTIPVPAIIPADTTPTPAILPVEGSGQSPQAVKQNPVAPAPTVPPTPETDLEIVKSADKVTYQAGTRARFRIRVTNPSAIPILDVVIRDPIQHNLPLAHRPRGSVLDNGVVTWHFAHLNPGRSVSVYYYAFITNDHSRYRCNKVTVTSTADFVVTLRKRTASCIHVATVEAARHIAVTGSR